MHWPGPCRRNKADIEITLQPASRESRKLLRQMQPFEDGQGRRKFLEVRGVRVKGTSGSILHLEWIGGANSGPRGRYTGYLSDHPLSLAAQEEVQECLC